VGDDILKKTKQNKQKQSKALYDGLVSVKSCITLFLLNIPTYSHSNTI